MKRKERKRTRAKEIGNGKRKLKTEMGGNYMGSEKGKREKT